MKEKINLYNSIVVLLSCFGTATLSYKIFDPYIPLNQVLEILLLILFTYLYLVTLNKWDICILFVSLALVLFSIFNSENDFKLNLKDAIYWFSTVFFLWKVFDKNISEKLFIAIGKCRTIIEINIIINSIIVSVGLFIEQCYNVNWGNRYYIGFAYSNHTLACGCCLSLVFSLFIFKYIKNIFAQLFIMFPYALGILQSGARTYVVSLFIIYIIYYIYYIKRIKIKWIITPVVILIGIYIFINSNIITKFINPTGYFKNSGIDIFTNGRTVFWLIDINAFFDMGILYKMIGNGFDYPYYINNFYYKLNIWAHNDFIDILLSIGIIGIVVYIAVIVKFSRKLYSCLGLKLALLPIAYFIIIAFFNGIFPYSHYLFSFIVLSIFLIGNNNHLRINESREYIEKSNSM